MHHPAETLDQRIGELSLQEGWKIAALWPAGADRADERAFQSLGEPPHVPRLGLDLIRGDVDLHVQRRADAAAIALDQMALEQKFAIERGNGDEPRIGEAPRSMRRRWVSRMLG